MASPGSPLPGGFVLGRLSHADRVGLVYRAHPGPDAPPGVATDANAVVLHPLHVEELRAWFEGMAVLGRSLRHPGLIEVLALGYTENDLPVVVTECVEGRTVRNDLLSGRDFPPTEVSRIVTAVADALDYLHSRPTPVLHRVIMPETVLLGERGGVKLLSVGHADRPHHPAAKPSALSPEELSGDRPLSPASDVFSLASLAYELLTSRPAFPGNAQGLLSTVARGALPRVALSQMEPATALDAVLHRAWTPEPAHRQRTAGMFAAELAAALASLPAGVMPARRQLRNPAMRTPTLPPPAYAAVAPQPMPVQPGSHPPAGNLRGLTPTPYPQGPRPASNPPPGLVPVHGRGAPGLPGGTPATGSWRPPVGLAPAPALSPYPAAWSPPPAPRLPSATPVHALPAPVLRVPSTPAQDVRPAAAPAGVPATSAAAAPELELVLEPAEITDPGVLEAIEEEIRSGSIPPSVPPPARAATGSTPPSASGGAETQEPAVTARSIPQVAGWQPGFTPAVVPTRDVPARGVDAPSPAVPLYAREIRITLPMLAALVLVNAVITAVLVVALTLAGVGHHPGGETPVAAGRCPACASAAVTTPGGAGGGGAGGTVAGPVALVPR